MVEVEEPTTSTPRSAEPPRHSSRRSKKSKELDVKKTMDTLKAFAAQKAQEAADIEKKMQEREEQLQSRIRQLEQQLEAAQHRASSSDVPAVHPPAQQQGTALTQQHTNHSLLDEMAAERDKSAQHHEEQLTRMAAELRTTANTVNEALQAMQSDMEQRVGAVQQQAQQALQEAQHARLNTETMRHALVQGLQHALMQLDCAPPGNAAAARDTAPAAAAAALRRPVADPEAAAPPAKRARTVATNGTAPRAPPPASLRAPVNQPVNDDELRRAALGIATPAESGELPNAAAAPVRNVDAAVHNAAGLSQHARSSSINTSAGSLDMGDGGVGASSWGGGVMQGVLAGLDTRDAVAVGQAMVAALVDGRVDARQCVRALDGALKSMVVNTVNANHVDRLQQYLGQLDLDGDAPAPIEHQQPRLPRVWLPSTNTQRHYAKLCAAVCECFAALATPYPTLMKELVCAVKDLLFMGRDREVKRSSKDGGISPSAPSLLRCCAWASLLSAAFCRAQMLPEALLCVAELLADQPHCSAFSFAAVGAIVDTWPALLGKLPLSRATGRKNGAVMHAVKQRGLLTNVLAESLFFLAVKVLPAPGEERPAPGTLQVLTATRIMRLWGAFYAWGPKKEVLPTPKPLLERMLTPWVHEVPCLTNDADAEMGAATWAELVTSVKVINAVASKTATVNAVWDEVNAMCDKAALEDAHHAVPATALAAALVGRVVGPHLLLSSDKRSQPSWWARMKDRVDALFAMVETHLPSTAGTPAPFPDHPSDDVNLLREELSEAVRVAAAVVGKKRNDKVEQAGAAVMQQLQRLRDALGELVPQWELPAMERQPSP